MWGRGPGGCEVGYSKVGRLLWVLRLPLLRASPLLDPSGQAVLASFPVWGKVEGHVCGWYSCPECRVTLGIHFPVLGTFPNDHLALCFLQPTFPRYLL